MAEETDSENRHFWNFTSHVTLTLTSEWPWKSWMSRRS